MSFPLEEQEWGLNFTPGDWPWRSRMMGHGKLSHVAARLAAAIGTWYLYYSVTVLSDTRHVAIRFQNAMFLA